MIRARIGFLRRHRDNLVALGRHRARHVGKRFRALQANFCHLPTRHTLNEQLGADESHGANVRRNVDEEIGGALARRGLCSGHT
jgi:hypothetical protein